MDERAAQIAAFHLPLDRLPDPLAIPVVTRPFDVTVRPPGSKSITNRALLLAALADGVSELRGALVDADDARVMIRAVEQLGARVEVARGGGSDGVDVVRVTGVAGRWKIPAGQTVTLNLGNAGTATRFLTAAAVLTPAESGGVIIDGDARMRERPIGELVAALSGMGVRTEYLGTPGHPPVRVFAPSDPNKLASTVTFSDVKSSQFISAMMLVAPFLARPTTIEVVGSVVSEPYIAMSHTLLGRILLQQSGPKISGRHRGATIEFRMPTWRLRGFRIDVEPDASGATYFEAGAAMIHGARATIGGLDLGPLGALQGDAEFVGVITAAGGNVERLDRALRITGGRVIVPMQLVLADMPDTAMTAAVLACFASPTSSNLTATSTLRGLRTLRVKETDRLEALRVELTRIGARVEIFRDGDDEGLRITPAPATQHHLAQSGEVVARDAREASIRPVYFDTYNDHRMAMALALVGLRRPNVFVRNPACVAKTYPTYWRDFAKLY